MIAEFVSGETFAPRGHRAFADAKRTFVEMRAFLLNKTRGDSQTLRIQVRPKEGITPIETYSGMGLEPKTSYSIGMDSLDPSGNKPCANWNPQTSGLKTRKRPEV